MDASLIPIWITSLASAGGVIFAIQRNGKRSKDQDSKLKNELINELTNIKQKLDNPDTGLSSIKKCVDDQQSYCLKTSTLLGTKVKRNEAEIEKLREKKSHQ